MSVSSMDSINSDSTGSNRLKNTSSDKCQTGEAVVDEIEPCKEEEAKNESLSDSLIEKSCSDASSSLTNFNKHDELICLDESSPIKVDEDHPHHHHNLEEISSLLDSLLSNVTSDEHATAKLEVESYLDEVIAKALSRQDEFEDFSSSSSDLTTTTTATTNTIIVNPDMCKNEKNANYQSHNDLSSFDSCLNTEYESNSSIITNVNQVKVLKNDELELFDCLNSMLDTLTDEIETLIHKEEAMEICSKEEESMATFGKGETMETREKEESIETLGNGEFLTTFAKEETIDTYSKEEESIETIETFAKRETVAAIVKEEEESIETLGNGEFLTTFAKEEESIETVAAIVKEVEESLETLGNGESMANFDKEESMEIIDKVGTIETYSKEDESLATFVKEESMAKFDKEESMATRSKEVATPVPSIVITQDTLFSEITESDGDEIEQVALDEDLVDHGAFKYSEEEISEDEEFANLIQSELDESKQMRQSLLDSRSSPNVSLIENSSCESTTSTIKLNAGHDLINEDEHECDQTESTINFEELSLNVTSEFFNREEEEAVAESNLVLSKDEGEQHQMFALKVLSESILDKVESLNEHSPILTVLNVANDNHHDDESAIDLEQFPIRSLSLADLESVEEIKAFLFNENECLDDEISSEVESKAAVDEEEKGVSSMICMEASLSSNLEEVVEKEISSHPSINEKESAAFDEPLDEKQENLDSECDKISSDPSLNEETPHKEALTEIESVEIAHDLIHIEISALDEPGQELDIMKPSSSPREELESNNDVLEVETENQVITPEEQTALVEPGEDDIEHDTSSSSIDTDTEDVLNVIITLEHGVEDILRENSSMSSLHEGDSESPTKVVNTAEQENSSVEDKVQMEPLIVTKAVLKEEEEEENTSNEAVAKEVETNDIVVDHSNSNNMSTSLGKEDSVVCESALKKSPSTESLEAVKNEKYALLRESFSFEAESLNELSNVQAKSETVTEPIVLAEDDLTSVHVTTPTILEKESAEALSEKEENKEESENAQAIQHVSTTGTKSDDENKLLHSKLNSNENLNSDILVIDKFEYHLNDHLNESSGVNLIDEDRHLASSENNSSSSDVLRHRSSSLQDNSNELNENNEDIAQNESVSSLKSSSTESASVVSSSVSSRSSLSPLLPDQVMDKQMTKDEEKIEKDTLSESSNDSSDSSDWLDVQKAINDYQKLNVDDEDVEEEAGVAEKVELFNIDQFTPMVFTFNASDVNDQMSSESKNVENSCGNGNDLHRDETRENSDDEDADQSKQRNSKDEENDDKKSPKAALNSTVDSIDEILIECKVDYRVRNEDESDTSMSDSVSSLGSERKNSEYDNINNNAVHGDDLNKVDSNECLNNEDEVLSVTSLENTNNNKNNNNETLPSLTSITSEDIFINRYMFIVVSDILEKLDGTVLT